MTAIDLDQLEAVYLAAPPGPYQPLGRPPRYFGLCYKANGGTHSVGGDGSIQPALVDFLLAAHTAVPQLIAEVRRLQAEVAALTDTNKKLRAKSARSS